MTTWMICKKGCVTTDPEHFTGDHHELKAVELTNNLTALSLATFRYYAKKRAMEYGADEAEAIAESIRRDSLSFDDGLGTFRGLVNVAKVYLAVGIAVGVCFLIARYM